jgi:hypothetical protein
MRRASATGDSVRGGASFVERSGVWAIREISYMLPDCPVLLESMVQPSGIEAELEMAARCFDTSDRRVGVTGLVSSAFV